jgi:hypothetical protein
MTRFRRWRLAPLLVVSAVVLAGLAAVTLLEDNQSFDGYRSGGAADPAEPTGTPGPRCSVAGTRALVEPAGAAFSFRLPSCFRTAEDGEIEFSAGAQPNVVARSAVVPADVEIVEGRAIPGLIIVSAGPLDAGLVGANEAAIEARLRQDLGRAGAVAGEPRRRTVDGAVGWGFPVRHTGEESMIWVFVKLRSQVQVVCRWIEPALRATVTGGCDEVVETLTIG